MNSFKTNDNGFTGLEAAIVLIAFVVVAAVFSYVVLGAGFFTTQKAQETIYNLQVIGNVYGLNSTADSGVKVVDEIRFTITVAPGSPSVDLSKMKLVFSTPNTPIITLSQNNTISASVSSFTTKLNGATQQDTMSSGEQVELDFFIAGVPKSTNMNFEIRPGIGAALPFTKTTPATVDVTNILH